MDNHQEPFELTEPEQRVLDCCAQGKIIDFCPDDPTSDNDTNPDHDEDWGEERTIRAEFLNRLLLEQPDDWRLHPHGLQLVGARITGALNLEFAQIPAQVLFIACSFDAPPNFDGASLPLLMFRNCNLPGLSAQRIIINSNFYLDSGFAATGAVDINYSTIAGQLACEDGTFNNPEGKAINAQGATIEGRGGRCG